MAIEGVDGSIKHGDFPVRYINVYQRGTTSQESHWKHGFIRQIIPKWPNY